jgi:hypothetical protein
MDSKARALEAPVDGFLQQRNPWSVGV